MDAEKEGIDKNVTQYDIQFQYVHVFAMLAFWTENIP